MARHSDRDVRLLCVEGAYLERLADPAVLALLTDAAHEVRQGAAARYYAVWTGDDWVTTHLINAYSHYALRGAMRGAYIETIAKELFAALSSPRARAAVDATTGRGRRRAPRDQEDDGAWAGDIEGAIAALLGSLAANDIPVDDLDSVQSRIAGAVLALPDRVTRDRILGYLLPSPDGPGAHRSVVPSIGALVTFMEEGEGEIRDKAIAYVGEARIERVSPDLRRLLSTYAPAILVVAERQAALFARNHPRSVPRPSSPKGARPSDSVDASEIDASEVLS